MSSLPPALLEQLLSELSTLASVYHKPPESIGGSCGSGSQRHSPAQNNVENLLDIDFDGAAPASAEQQSNVNTPDRMASPAGGAPSGNMADMMGLFDAPPPQQQQNVGGNAGGSGMNHMMNGFADLNFGGASSSSQPPPAAMQLHPQQQSGGGEKKTNEDLLGLF
ncbi:hypothetical protein HYQ45_018328 [Verticillium longisporum]|uniref:Uncharacterized protein n=1 Tax=Verticillium longisporum TaxID=100787 RepID=A0A8I2Z354_VERLO|nr:hypothetical protein HYQ45_018328 [Verticillium longisporum]